MRLKLCALTALVTAACVGSAPNAAAAQPPLRIAVADNAAAKEATDSDEGGADASGAASPQADVDPELQEPDLPGGDDASGGDETPLSEEETADPATPAVAQSDELDDQEQAPEEATDVADSPAGIAGEAVTFGLVNGGTPKTNYSGSSIAGTALQSGTWAAYVSAGDDLVVDLVTPDDGYVINSISQAEGGPFTKGYDKTPLRVEIVRPNGTVASTKSVVTGAGKQLGATFTNISAAHEGVWRIRVIDGATSDPRDASFLELAPRLKWNIYVPGKPGSVWTSTVNIGNNWKSYEGPGSDSLEMWALNSTGKQYKVEAPNYNGVHSTFRMNNLGVTSNDKDADGNCVRQPLSVPMRDAQEVMLNGKKATEYRVPSGEGTGENECPNLQPYRLFTKKPHSSLPVSSPGYGWVKPVYVPAEIKDFTLDRSTGVLTGTVTQSMNLIVTIGAEGADAQAVTKKISVAPGTKKQILKWDRKDASGAIIPMAKKLKVTVTGDGASYIHLTRTDAEHSNGGVRFTDLHTNEVKKVSWDDSQLAQAAGRQSVGFAKKVSNGNGALHAWNGTGTTPENRNGGSWGNFRVINDWVSETYTKTITLQPSAILTPQLRIDKTQVGNPVYAADQKTATVTWKVDVKNSGNGAVSNTVMKDIYPAGATNQQITAQPSQGTFKATTGVWNIGTLAAGKTVTVSFSAVIPTASAFKTQKYTNRAIVSGTDLPRRETGVCQVNQGVDVDTDQCDEVQTTLEGPKPEVKIDKTQLGDPVYAEDRKSATVTWRVTVKSTGNAPAENIVMKDVYPKGAKSPKQVTAPSQGTFDAATGSWTVGTLKNGSSATVTLSVTLPTADAFKSATHTNRAIVSASDLPRKETGDCQTNDTVDADTDQCDEVATKLDGPSPGWQMAKASNPKSGSEIAAGQPITYTLTVRNTGDVPLEGIKITDTLTKVTPHATLQGAPQEQVANEKSVARPNAITGDTLAWATPSIPAGEQATLTYTYQLNDDAWGVAVDNAAFGTLTYDNRPLPPDSCGKSASDPCTTDHLTPKWPSSGLPVLGGIGSPGFMLGGLAIISLAATVGLVLHLRNKRRQAAN